MQRRKIKVRVNGKVNLSLNITGVKGGYHLLDTVMASVGLADTVTVCERLDDKVCVEFSDPRIDARDNCVTAAVKLLSKNFGAFGADIYVEKRLPLSGGMGGSSADSAGVLVALDALYGFTARGGDMGAMAALLGSDVNFILGGGYARCTGRGEVLAPFAAPPLPLVLVFLDGVLTKDCFGAFDALHKSGRLCPSDNDALVAALQKGDSKNAARQLRNALETSAASLLPDIPAALRALDGAGAAASFMTGSGSTCVGLFGSGGEAERAAERLKKNGLRAASVTTAAAGWEIL